MKALKKAMSVLVSLLMIFTFALPAFAEGTATTYTIKAPETNHQYEIYQIFTGDLANGTLSNIKWGQNGTGTLGDAVDTAVINALTAVGSETDREKLAVVEQYANLTGKPVATISNGATYQATAGYYLIKDKDNSVSGTDSYTTYIVTVVGDVNITPKSAVPSFEKKVKDINDTTGGTSDWQDSADYDIGDEVPFKLEGTVASNYDAYKTYYFAFHDKEEIGLAFNSESVKVCVDGVKITTGYVVANAPKDKDSFDIVFDDLKAIPAVKKDSVITVEYTSTLTERANIGNQGNVNTAYLEFSNNPNDEKKGSTGTTPKDSVIVFTYQVVVDKVNENKQPLTGAEFTLEKVLKDNTKKPVAVVKSDEGTEFTFKGLDDGDYILTETKTPAGYNTIDPIRFTVTANHTVVWESEERTEILTGLTGNVATGNITFTASADKGTLDTTVENHKGATLPGTGGIGTTIFYVVGGLLMLGAAVLLITKKRMSGDK
ncbi:isopeptide-forming domain-containing fimbrial protein [Gemmiger sp.]